MPVMILMPALSPTMEMGTLTKWYVKEGQTVSAGDVLADIETDKATMEFEAVEDGKITRLLVSEGTSDILVNQEIAEINLEDEEEILKTNLSTIAIKTVNEKDIKTLISPENVTPSVKSQITKSENIETKNRPRISPLAKRIAAKHELDLTKITGSGPYGRVIKKDVLQHIDSLLKLDPSGATENNEQKISEPPENNTKPILTDIYKDREHTLLPLSGIRKIVSNRLSESKSTIPHFYLRRSIYLDKLIKLRFELNDSFTNSSTKFSINDFIIKAVAKSLQDNPKCNAIWANDHIIQLKSSDVSVAVAIEDGLITPVIRDAEKKNLQEISVEMKEKAGKARAKKLLPSEYTGGSCSISNLGMMGIENFDAVINPPQASILAVGSAIKKPLVNNDGEIFVGSLMSITLSADHRVIDGAVGAVFVASIVDYLSNPLRLII